MKLKKEEIEDLEKAIDNIFPINSEYSSYKNKVEKLKSLIRGAEKLKFEQEEKLKNEKSISSTR